MQTTHHILPTLSYLSLGNYNKVITKYPITLQACRYTVFFKSIIIWWRYEQEYGVTTFDYTKVRCGANMGSSHWQAASLRHHDDTAVGMALLGFIRRRRTTRQQLCSIDDWTQHLGTSVDAVARQMGPNERTNGRRRNWTNCERRVTSYDAACRLRNKWFVLSTPRSTLPQSVVNPKCAVASLRPTQLCICFVTCHAVDFHFFVTNTAVTCSDVNESSRLRGRSAEDSEVRGGGVPLPTGNTPSSPGKESGEWANFFVCDLKMAYFGEFWGANFSFFFVVSSLSRVWGRLCGKLWIFEQSNEQKTSLNAVTGRGRLILVRYMVTFMPMKTENTQLQETEWTEDRQTY